MAYEDVREHLLRDAEWKGEISAKLNSIEEKTTVLFSKLDEHVEDDKHQFEKAAEARKEIRRETQKSFSGIREEFKTIRCRIGKSELRLAIIFAIASIVFALLMSLVPKVADSWFDRNLRPNQSVSKSSQE